MLVQLTCGKPAPFDNYAGNACLAYVYTTATGTTNEGMKTYASKQTMVGT